MLKKRIAMGILAGLLACSFIAGCGGGDKGTSEPPKPKPIAADLPHLDRHLPIARFNAA